MSRERKRPVKRGYALNDATEGQFGEEPRAEPNPGLGRENDTINPSKRSRNKRVGK